MVRICLLIPLCFISCAAPLKTPEPKGIPNGPYQPKNLPVADSAVVQAPERHKPDPTRSSAAARERILLAAHNLVGVRESGGNNRGPEVDRIIRNGGWNPLEAPAWCGLANRYVYDIAEEKDKGPQGRDSAWSPNWLRNPTWTQAGKGATPLPGDAWGIAWEGSDGVYRVRHTGLNKRWGFTALDAYEGNTTEAGTADSLTGDSYMARKRPIRSIYAVRNWVD